MQELEPDEVAEVESLLKDPEINREYQLVQHLLENIAFQYSLVPSPVLKTLILKEVSIDTNPGSTQGNIWKWMIAASVIMVLSSLFIAFHFWNKWKITDNELSSLMAQHLELAENLNQVNNELGTIRNSLSILISPEYSRVLMKGTENAPSAQAVIYWNPSQEKVFLHTSTLPILQQNQQYQLWALVDGQPIDAGVFDANQNAFVQMKNISKADAFAVTIEKRGGSDSPTLPTMQVFGSISS